MSWIVKSDVEFVNASTIDNNDNKTKIKAAMAPFLDKEQNLKLASVLDSIYGSCNFSNEELLEKFVNAKTIVGLSSRTISFYLNVILDFERNIERSFVDVSPDDIRRYLKIMQDRGCSKVTMNNNRRNLSAFFSWLENEEYIRRSPLRKVDAIKTRKVIKQPFSSIDVEKMRNAIIEESGSRLKTLRNRAIFEFLLSSGVRISEAVGLNKDDIDLQNMKCIVTGKGDKQRIVRFSSSAKLFLQDYLSGRTDQEDALFVSLQKPFRRLHKNGVEILIREIGKAAGVKNAHPHRFRRTFATNAISRGIPIEQVQLLLGHEQISTTTRYAIVDELNVMDSVRRLMD